MLFPLRAPLVPRLSIVPRLSVLLLLALLLGAGCSTVRLTDTWRAPDVERFNFARLVTVAIAPGAIDRDKAEDEMAALLDELNLGTTNVPLHKVLPELSLNDIEHAKETLRLAGFDGALVVRVVGGASRFRYQSLSGTSSITGSPHDRTPDIAFDSSRDLVRLETIIYSLKENRLIWSGMSTAIRHRSVARLMSSLASEVQQALEREGLLEQGESA